MMHPGCGIGICWITKKIYEDLEPNEMGYEINGLIMGLKQSSLSIVALGFKIHGFLGGFHGDWIGINGFTFGIKSMIANESYTLEELNVSYYCTWGIRHCYISLISPIDGKLQPMKLDIKKKTIPFGVISYLARWEIASQPGKRWENHQTQCRVGGWPTPLKNMTSSVGMIIPYIVESHESHVPKHQPDVALNGFPYMETPKILVYLWRFLGGKVVSQYGFMVSIWDIKHGYLSMKKGTSSMDYGSAVWKWRIWQCNEDLTWTVYVPIIWWWF